MENIRQKEDYHKEKSHMTFKLPQIYFSSLLARSISKKNSENFIASGNHSV